MPYIFQHRRQELAQGSAAESAGELNYLITMTCHAYMRRNGISYQKYNDVIGALEGAKLEFYRRQVTPYEDIKIKENGDV